jgi:hypothetical protein
MKARDGLIDLDTADIETVAAPPINKVLAAAMIPGSGVAAAIVGTQTTAAVAAGGKTLQECAAFSHGTTRVTRIIMWPWPRVRSDAFLVSFIGRPVDVTLMMFANDYLPLLARQTSQALLTCARSVKRRLRSRLAIDVGACIDGVGEYMVDGVIAGLHPADLGMSMHLQWELHPLVAEPQPDAARRAGFGETLKHAIDGSDDGFVRVEEHLTVLIAPDEANGQATPELAAFCLIANATVEACTQDVQLGLAHSSFEAKQQAIVEEGGMIDAVGIADQRVGEAGEIDEPVPISVVASEPRHLEAEHETDTR